MTPAEKPTTPVAPNTATFRPRRSRWCFSRSVFSTHATSAAAVVNDPAGSANTDSPNGGTSAFLAAAIMSRASTAFLPPKNIPVRAPVFGGREKMASWTRPGTSPRLTSVWVMTTSQPASTAMFTSNGLMCLSGVTMCRMYFSAMIPLLRAASSVSRIERSMDVDLSAAIEPRANADVQGPQSRVAPDKLDEPVCLRRRRSERKTGRSPGTLPDAVRACFVETRERGGDIGAGETAAALNRREIIADPRLQLTDRGTEARQIAFGDGRQRLHENEAAMVRGFPFRKRRKRGEGCAFFRSMDPPSRRVEHQDDAPLLRKGQSTDDRRRRGRRAAPGVEDQAAALQHPHADPGAAATPEPNGVAAQIERKLVQAADARRDRQRDLRSGPQTRMGGNRLLDLGRIGAAQSQMPLHGLEVLPHACVLRALDVRGSCGADADPRAQFGDRQADAGKTPPQTSARIEKTQMQPCRRRDGDACRGRRRIAAQSVSPGVLPPNGFC